MLFSDLALSRRLEAAEGYACREFALVRSRLFPERGSQAIRVAGADVVFDGTASPVTQTFGLGLLENPTPEDLDEIEQFFSMRAAPTQHEVSPFAGAATLQLLCARGYRPIEVSSVLYQPIELPFETAPRLALSAHIGVRVIGAEESRLWSEVGAGGWAHEHPELEEFALEMGTLLIQRENSVCFLAEIDKQPAAAGALSIHEGVALFAGASTLPEFRRRGLQAALLGARIRYACDHGCDLAMMVAEAGSNSQRNAQRQGFLVAYTRLKWRKEEIQSTVMPGAIR
jgi:GNAT superfamily N-acetyltransferase